MNKASSTILISLASSIILVAVKLGAGIWGHSFALIADAVESGTDVGASILLWLALRYSEKPADENHPYGHGRIEPLMTFLVVALLIMATCYIGYQSYLHIITPHALPAAWTLYILGIIIVGKELSYRYLMRKSKEMNSTVLKADAWHHRSDALTSVAAFVGICIALYMGPGYENADDWAAILATLFILYNCFYLFTSAYREIMDEHVYDDLKSQIREVAQSVKGVIETEKCFIRKSGAKYHIELHAVVDGLITVKAGHDIAHQLVDALNDQIPTINHVSVHIEPDGYH